MMNYTRHSLKKLETVFTDIGYRVIYEKGTFQSGFCILESTNVVVINRFYDIESRINTLLDILSGIDVDREMLSDPSLVIFDKLIASMEPELT